MKLVINLALFFVLFLPLTYIVGIPGDYWVGRYQDPDTAPTIYHWMSVGWPLILPSLLWVPVCHVAITILGRARVIRSSPWWRACSLVIWPAGFLAVHVAIYGLIVWSLPLLVTFLLPGMGYGALARIPVRPETA